MRTRHDDVCLWWKDWHSCSCGYIEEEIRNEKLVPITIEQVEKWLSLVDSVEIDLSKQLKSEDE